MKRLPARTRGDKKILIEFPKEMGGNDFKYRLRNMAKHNRLYHLPIETEPEVYGRSDTGMPIPINTLGRWLFGVPGYMGNAKFLSFSEPPVVELPAEAPQEAVRLFEKLGGRRREL